MRFILKIIVIPITIVLFLWNIAKKEADALIRRFNKRF